jgi:hypothetical protein
MKTDYLLMVFEEQRGAHHRAKLHVYLCLEDGQLRYTVQWFTRRGENEGLACQLPDFFDTNVKKTQQHIESLLKETKIAGHTSIIETTLSPMVTVLETRMMDALACL